MTIPKYKDPTTGQWLPVGLPKSPEIPISDTPPTNGRWWLDTSEEGELEMYGIKMELLWENASMDSEFGPQTINLDLSKYSKVKIEFSHYLNESSISFEGRVGFDGYGFVMEGSTSMFRHARNYHVTQTGIQFFDAYEASGANGSFVKKNQRMVPRRIYGIKEVS